MHGRNLGFSCMQLVFVLWIATVKILFCMKFFCALHVIIMFTEVFSIWYWQCNEMGFLMSCIIFLIFLQFCYLPMRKELHATQITRDIPVISEYCQQWIFFHPCRRRTSPGRSNPQYFRIRANGTLHDKPKW